MSRLNIKQHIRGRVLNHTQGGVVGVYDQNDYLYEKADALNKLGKEGEIDATDTPTLIRQSIDDSIEFLRKQLA